MKVLFITHTYPPSLGGMQKQSYELIDGFSRRGEVCKLVYDSSCESKFVFFLLLRRRVRKLLGEHKDISLIHLNDGLMGVFGLFLRSLTDLPIVVTIHGLDIVHPSKLFQNYILPRFKVAYQGFIAVSRFSASECERRGFKAVHVVNNGVDGSIADIVRDDGFLDVLRDKYGIELGVRRFILSVGRPVFRKGFSWFLREVLPSLPEDIVYIVVGPRFRGMRFISFLLGLLPYNLSRKISLLFGFPVDAPVIFRFLGGVGGRVFYMSSPDFSDIVQLFKHSLLFVMPNRKVSGDVEGFGLVALEASLSGAVVLCSAVDGIIDAVIDGENGFHVMSGDKRAWIEVIEGLLSRGDDYLRVFGEGACSYTRGHYSWEKMVDGYYNIFERLLDA